MINISGAGLAGGESCATNALRTQAASMDTATALRGSVYAIQTGAASSATKVTNQFTLLLTEK
jgi:hypothetical protein